MSKTLATFEKQPGEIEDFDISFTEYLQARSDEIADFTVTADAGITIASSFEVSDPDVVGTTGGMIKVYLSGGTDGAKYKITATILTVGARTKEGEITVKVKEI
jgi:hypothetical protein